MNLAFEIAFSNAAAGMPTRLDWNEGEENEYEGLAMHMEALGIYVIAASENEVAAIGSTLRQWGNRVRNHPSSLAFASGT